MSSNPQLIHSIAREHIAELRRHDARGKTRRSVTPGPLCAIRMRSGWLLVGLGLRLVMPGDRASNRLTNPAGH
jgi:hypothetical protein